jgi:Lrp/AsnC family transcriptional regulator, regulator for asnA, asnC and gidA
MKQSDLRILQHLRENSRTSLTTISRKTGIPVSTIFDRIRSYESGFVHKFTALVDFSKLGYTVRANILLKIEPGHREKVKGYLMAHPRVNTIQRVNNGFDYAAECVFMSIKESEEFIEELEMQFKVIGKLVFHIIDDVAREKLLTH